MDTRMMFARVQCGDCPRIVPSLLPPSAGTVPAFAIARQSDVDCPAKCGRLLGKVG